ALEAQQALHIRCIKHFAERRRGKDDDWHRRAPLWPCIQPPCGGRRDSDIGLFHSRDGMLDHRAPARSAVSARPGVMPPDVPGEATTMTSWPSSRRCAYGAANSFTPSE